MKWWWRSPGYRLATRWASRHWVLTPLFTVVFAILWLGPCLASPFLRDTLKQDQPKYLILALVLGRSAGTLLIWLAAIVAGVLTFRREKQDGTLEQLALTPMGRLKVILSRSTGALLPLAPSLLIAAFGGTICLDYLCYEARRVWFVNHGEIVRLAVVTGTIVATGCLPLFGVGLLRSIRPKSTALGLARAFLLAVPIFVLEYFMGYILDLSVYPVWFNVLFFCIINLAITACLVSLAVIRFDRLVAD